MFDKSCFTTSARVNIGRYRPDVGHNDVLQQGQHTLRRKGGAPAVQSLCGIFMNSQDSPAVHFPVLKGLMIRRLITSIYNVSVSADGDHDGKILEIKWMTLGQ